MPSLSTTTATLASPVTTTGTLSPNPSSSSKARGLGGSLLTRGSLGGETLVSQMVQHCMGQCQVWVPNGLHTTTMLSWSVIEFGGLMKGELQNAREAIRWATDYLLKATAQPDTIYVQVGDANKDHACWERPEDMDTPRNVFKIDRNTPGSDVAGETAAALAAASLVFRRTDPTYAKLLVRRAIRVFEFADKYRGPYSNGLKRFVCPFYCSYSGYQVRMSCCGGAAWLQRATKNPMYLHYIQVNGQTLGADETDNTFGWDNKHVGARILLSKAFLVQKVQSLHDYKGHADNYICSLIPGNPFSQAQYTPGGLLFKMSDSNMQYVTSTSFLLLAYAKYLTSAHKVVNCGGLWSPLVASETLPKNRCPTWWGYGPHYPRRIHHRGSSLPSIAGTPGKDPMLIWVQHHDVSNPQTPIFWWALSSVGQICTISSPINGPITSNQSPPLILTHPLWVHWLILLTHFGQL
ncbi:cellulase 2 [Actinidia rufa]|uniref:cellulase n=1 Tax=Actinidia rufa TaxID=165716 RepID=A0A7J0GSJ4_9ERIC|nr:cellulase 2 [Actinidia rufa]